MVNQPISNRKKILDSRPLFHVINGDTGKIIKSTTTLSEAERFVKNSNLNSILEISKKVSAFSRPRKEKKISPRASTSKQNNIKSEFGSSFNNSTSKNPFKNIF